MSTLSMRLKQRARMLAAGVALSAATLALIPGVAEATDPADCVCRLVGDITNTEEPASGGQPSNNDSGNDDSTGGNSADESIGTVQGVNAAPDLNTQAALLDSENNLSDSGSGSPASGSNNGSGSNSADGSIG